MRVGFGYDVHKLAKGRKLFLGGIEIPHSKGCVAHSDGDVIIHAVCDALLGAANLRDIGFHFPDSSETYKGIDSKILLKDTLQLIVEKKYQISNIDITVALQRPKLVDFIEKMKTKISEVLETDVDDISLKATTTEKLGFVGTENGVAAYAVALIYKEN